MTITERLADGVTVLDLEGRLTIEELRDMQLVNRVRQLLQAGRRLIVLNLAGVPYIDTTGLCNIVEAYIATRRQEGSVKLENLRPHVREVFAITRLLTVFDAFDSEREAIASFQQTATG